MKMSSMVGICSALALCIAAGSAQAGPGAAKVGGKIKAKHARKTVDFRKAHLNGHLYINLATGERRVTPIGVGNDFGDPQWSCNDIAGNGNYFWPLDGCLDPGVPFCTGGEALDWGDVADGTFVDGFEFAYAGDEGIGFDPNGEGVPGFNCEIRYYGTDNGFGDPNGTLLAGFSVVDLPGHSGQYAYEGWIVTVDLAGSGYEFNVTGGDEDGDGLTDFAYSYSFDQQQDGGPGAVGPFLSAPNPGPGQEDAFDLYTEPEKSGYFNSLFFGGFPFAGFDMVLYGSTGGGNECYPDFDNNDVLDLFDFLGFVNAFNSQDPSADCEDDGVFDLFDFLCFVNAFNAGC